MKLPNRLTLSIIAGIALVVVVGECRDWLSKRPHVEYRPQVGQLTAEAEDWPRSTVTAELQLPDLPPAELERIGKKYQRADLAGGSRNGGGKNGHHPTRLAESPASEAAGPVATPVAGHSGGYVSGSILRGARPLGEWSFKSPDEECELDVAAFLELDGRVTTSELWKNTPADNPPDFVAAPLRWRLTVGGTAWPRATTFAALGFRAVRLNRLELSPAVMAGYDFTPGAGDGAWGGVGAIGTFDF